MTTGVTGKFSVGGGDGVCHSRPVARHGLSTASFPYRIDQIRYARGSTYPRPRIEAPAVDMTFKTWNSGGYA